MNFSLNKLLRIHLPKPIFSPLSGGKLKPNIVINEIRMHGKIKLTTKYNVLRTMCISLNEKKAYKISPKTSKKLPRSPRSLKKQSSSWHCFR